MGRRRSVVVQSGDLQVAAFVGPVATQIFQFRQDGVIDDRGSREVQHDSFAVVKLAQAFLQAEPSGEDGGVV